MAFLTKITDENIENWGRSRILSETFLVKIVIWDNWILVNLLRFFTYKMANFWGIDLKSSQNMHLICIYCILKGLNIKKHFSDFYNQITNGKTDVYSKKSVFRPYLGQYLSRFEKLWCHYDRGSKIFKLSTYTHYLY